MIQRLQARLTRKRCRFARRGRGTDRYMRREKERERESYVRVLTIHFHFALLHSTVPTTACHISQGNGNRFEECRCETTVGNTPSVPLRTIGSSLWCPAALTAHLPHHSPPVPSSISFNLLATLHRDILGNNANSRRSFQVQVFMIRAHLENLI